MRVLKIEDLRIEKLLDGEVNVYDAKKGEEFGEQLFLMDKENEGHLYEVEIDEPGLMVYLSRTLVGEEVWIYKEGEYIK